MTKERRSLVTGLNDTPAIDELEKQFVFGGKPSKSTDASTVAAEQSTETPVAEKEKSVLPQYKGRVPLTTRCRPELASALKRASLERQLDGVEPNSIQDIIEVAIENWLHAESQKLANRV
ncbi:hypothetical protein FF011L_01420 [Roseimaritima multifibrata]|uniref:Uncharacterized protein n=1 Tax=Roseimaritima multifibrata TaxID=1930274 RepID=A0A517M953_9BACT|nr:hypothetical protein [Roseimaritima multifibrata]QDS91412.1 hypothetical protein FF011L_01420 [Roseimaritima multifibrata]